jgi:rSAM/selenodomain-associated transferase 1
MPFAAGAIIVMAKYPQAGKVKTRLMPDLSAHLAAKVHRVFLQHCMARLSELRAAELVLCFDPVEKSDALRDLFDNLAPITFLPQVDGDLGVRLGAAAREMSSRHQRLLFLGVDSPDLPLAHLKKAAELLDRSEVSLSPTDDGGFWSLGLQNHVNAQKLLADIPWSSGREAMALLRSAEALGHTAVTGPAWDDVDRPADLRRLISRLVQSSENVDRRLLSNLRHVLPVEWFSC